jgi:prepilin-type N-terminal cleavage/methylation domain-containing protein
MGTNVQGVTLPEILVVLLIAGLILTIGVAFSLPWIGREEARSGVYQIQSQLQLARIQAITRNRPCRFVLDTAGHRMQVVDVNDPSDSTDDILLADTILSPRVVFGRPDTGSPITLQTFSTGIFGATFASDGSVSSGAGEVVLFGGDRYERLYLLGAGGVRVEHWDGTRWALGS